MQGGRKQFKFEEYNFKIFGYMPTNKNNSKVFKIFVVVCFPTIQLFIKFMRKENQFVEYLNKFRRKSNVDIFLLNFASKEKIVFYQFG